MEIKRDILWRVYLSFIGIVVLGFFIFGRAIYIQQVQGSHWRSMGDSLHQRIEEIDAERGTIYSEDGQMLSTSIPYFDIYIDFAAEGLRDKDGKRFKENVDSFAYSLATYFNDKSAAQYKRELQAAYKSKDRYYSLRKKMSFEDYKAFREFPLAKLGKNKSGIIVETNTKRLTPFGLLANRTIGLSREFVTSDGRVKKMNVGLEKSYDSLLTGQKGERLVRYIAGGAAKPVDGYQVEPENGKDIFTTLDVNIQDIAQNALLKMMDESEAQYGTCIVMETKTGKIKAMANLGRNKEGKYDENNNYALNVTEPGSTIKLATLLAVLEEGKSAVTDVVEVGTAGQMVVGPRTVNDAERSPKPLLTVKECFAHSSNVGMGKLAYKAFANNPAKIRDYFHAYGLDIKSPVDLTDVPKPRLAPLAKDAGGAMNMVTMSYGYAIQVSPLHTLALYNAIANDGKMMKPYLVNSIQRNGEVVRQFNPEIISKAICKPATVKAAKESMEAVVTEGTARAPFKDMPFAVAGKTGTAHVADGNIKYDDGVYQASFVGYFPADNPQYSCIVVVRTKPHAAIHYGGQLGAPVFREVATKLYAMYVNKKPSVQRASLKKDSAAFFYAGLTADIKKVLTETGASYRDSVQQAKWSAAFATGNFGTLVKANPVATKLMPVLKGMGLKDAVYIVENMGMKIIPKGKGKVIAQSVQPGSQVGKGTVVYVELGS